MLNAEVKAGCLFASAADSLVKSFASYPIMWK
jgi:hypothetical protein